MDDKKEINFMYFKYCFPSVKDLFLPFFLNIYNNCSTLVPLEKNIQI